MVPVPLHVEKSPAVKFVVLTSDLCLDRLLFTRRRACRKPGIGLSIEKHGRYQRCSLYQSSRRAQPSLCLAWVTSVSDRRDDVALRGRNGGDFDLPVRRFPRRTVPAAIFVRAGTAVREPNVLFLSVKSQ